MLVRKKFWFNMIDKKVLIESDKTITVFLKSSNCIIDYLSEEKNLKSSVVDIYGDHAPEMQCRIAYRHFGDKVKGYGFEVFEQMKKGGSYDVDQFFARVFGSIFPASFSTMMLEYDAMKQGCLRVTEYARIMRILCEAMEFCLEKERFKFILGLSDKEIRETLLRADLTRYDFEGLVRYSASLENTLLLSSRGVVER